MVNFLSMKPKSINKSVLNRNIAHGNHCNYAKYTFVSDSKALENRAKSWGKKCNNQYV